MTFIASASLWAITTSSEGNVSANRAAQDRVVGVCGGSIRSVVDIESLVHQKGSRRTSRGWGPAVRGDHRTGEPQDVAGLGPQRPRRPSKGGPDDRRAVAAE